VTETRADLSTADLNDLPDDAFAYIEPGGTKDSEGKTTPRSLRHFAIHDAAHVRDALARLSSSPFGDRARPKVIAAAHKFGIEVDESKSADRRLELLSRRRRLGLSRDGVRQIERRGMLLEMRAKPDGTGGTTFEFKGYGAVFDSPFEMWDPWGDPYSEVVRPGAFTRTLSASPDVPFLIGHNDAGIPLARTRSGSMRLSQDSRGLHVLATMDGARSDVRNLASAVERGDLDEMSIGFVTMGQEWSPDWETRAMLDLELHRGDVSAVALAANPATRGASMTALPTENLSRQAAEERARDEIHDSDSHPDFNVPAYDPVGHGPESAECPNPACPVYAGTGQRALNAKDAKFCDQCGAPLYGEDGLIVTDDNGVVEEVGGAMADADLLSMRLRLLELA